MNSTGGLLNEDIEVGELVRAYIWPITQSDLNAHMPICMGQGSKQAPTLRQPHKARICQ